MPPALDHVVRKCLEKDPDDRWQSAHDVASELRWIAEAGSQAGVPATVTMRRRSRERLAWILAGALAAATLGSFGWALHLRRVATEADQLLRVEVVPPADVELAPVVTGALALSPDGQRLAVVVGGLSKSDLAVRELASGETHRLAGTDGGTFPFWSPDSRWLAFFAEERLKKVEAAGGPVQVICEAHAGRGGAWSPDGTIVFAPDITGPLVKVSAGGGAPTATTHTTDPSTTHRNPRFLPDGRHFLFTARETSSASFGAVAVGSLDGGDPKVLLPRGSNPQYADGFLLSVLDGNLLAQRFDADKQALEGQALPIADAIEYWNPRDLANFSVSQTGLLVYRQIRLRRTQLVWLDRTGKELARIGEPSNYAGLHLGADGHTLAAVLSDSAGGNADAWSVDLRTSQTTRSTFLSAPSSIFAAASPDGARLAVGTSAVGASAGSTLWIQPISGSGSRQPLLEKGSFNVSDWSKDGAYLIGDTQAAESGFDVAYLALKDPAKTVHLTTSRFDERAPALSPDGRWIAYQSNETGRNEIFVTDFPAGARKWQISRSGGETASWRSDGRELYFSTAEEARAVSVIVRNGSLDAGTPERLSFSKETISLATGVAFSDGKRFLVQRFASGDATEPIRLVRSWRRIVEK
jgi:Tol biopolymer transport system component